MFHWKNETVVQRTRNIWNHRLRTPREEIAFTARPKIQSQSQIFRYGRSIFCLPHRLNFSDIFDLCLHWVSVVRDLTHRMTLSKMIHFNLVKKCLVRTLMMPCSQYNTVENYNIFYKIDTNHILLNDNNTQWAGLG